MSAQCEVRVAGHDRAIGDHTVYFRTSRAWNAANGIPVSFCNHPSICHGEKAFSARNRPRRQLSKNAFWRFGTEFANWPNSTATPRVLAVDRTSDVVKKNHMPVDPTASSSPAKPAPTLGLTGLTMNAMALIAPGAFLWLTFQIQSLYGAPLAGWRDVVRHWVGTAVVFGDGLQLCRALQDLSGGRFIVPLRGTGFRFEDPRL